jgi:hypothetical protein
MFVLVCVRACGADVLHPTCSCVAFVRARSHALFTHTRDKVLNLKDGRADTALPHVHTRWCAHDGEGGYRPPA